MGQRTGSRNNLDSDVTDDNANWTKDSDARLADRPLSLMSYGLDMPPAEVTSDVTGSSVFLDVDYSALRQHVVQGDLDHRVITGDRKSLDSRKLVLVYV